jgi:hypothetical protein
MKINKYKNNSCESLGSCVNRRKSSSDRRSHGGEVKGKKESY